MYIYLVMFLFYIDDSSGVKKARDDREECILQVLLLPLIKEFPVSMLSDEYFKKVWCSFHVLHQSFKYF